jgi:hypothetical protein
MSKKKKKICVLERVVFIYVIVWLIMPNQIVYVERMSYNYRNYHPYEIVIVIDVVEERVGIERRK